MENNTYYQFEEKGPLLRFFSNFFFVLFFVFSSLSLSLLIFICLAYDWQISKYYSTSSFDFFLSIFPYTLFLLFLLFTIFTLLFFFFGRTNRNANYYNGLAVIIFLIFSLGIISYYFGFSQKIDNIASNYSIYYFLAGNRDKVWQAPALGLLSGEIGIIKDQNDFLLVGFDSQTWNIKSNDPIIPDKSIIKTGNKIKLIGRIDQNNSFEAKEIIPYD